MANSILQILIQAKNQAAGAFRQVETEVKGLTTSLDRVNKLLGAFGLAIGASEAVQLGKQLSDAARAANDAKGALTAAVQGITTYKEAMAAAQQVTEGMVSRTELASALTTIYGSKLASSAQEAAQLASAGSILTGVFKDAGASMDLYVRLLNSGSRELFNNFGLSQQLVSQLQAQIEASGKLSGEEARLEAVRIGLLQTAEKYKAALSDDTVAAKQFEAATSDLQAALGQLILPTVTESMANLGVVIRGTADAMNELPGPVQAAAQGLIDMVSPLTTINALIRDFQGLTGDASAASDAYQSSLYQVQIAASGTEAGLTTTSNSLEAMGFSAQGAAEGLDPLIQKLNASNFAAREAAAAYRETAAAAQSQAAAEAFGGQQSEFAQERNLSRIQAAGDRRLEYQEEQQRAEEQAAKASERQAKQQAQTITQAFSEVGNQISSAVSSAVSQSSTDIAGLLGFNAEGEQRVNEGVRRMAAVATGGLANEWTQQLASQLQGVSAADAFVKAVSGGNDAAVREEARKLATNPIVELFDAQMIATQIEQQMRAQQLQQVLNDKVNALLGEKGLPAVQQITQQVGTVATDVGAATAAAGESAAGLATNSEAAAERMSKTYDGAITKIEVVNRLIRETIGLTERWGEVTQNAVDKFNSVGPGAATQPNGAPSNASKKMGGPSPL